MREGRNPLDGKRVTQMPKMAACVITHLPNQEGYHRERMEVIQICLTTMREHAERELPFYIWDNGSCPEMRDWLRYEFRPEFLTFSPNIGKGAARSSVVRAFPPETVLCISDDDMYYYPGWLEPQLELLRGFPNVGAVSGYPVRTQFRWGVDSTIQWAKEHAQINVGRFIPDEWDKDFCESVGRDYNWHRFKHTRNDLDIIVTYNGMSAYATAHHCQWITVAGRIEYIVQWDGEALSNERKLDEAIDKEGYLRLTTLNRYTKHIGNVLDPELKQVMREKVLA